MFNSIISYTVLFGPAAYVIYYTFKNSKTVKQMTEESNQKYDRYLRDTKKYIKLHPNLLHIDPDSINIDQFNVIKQDFIKEFNVTEEHDILDVYFNRPVFKSRLSELQREDKKPRE